MTVWNQSSFKHRTYKTPKPYKPVEPIGMKLTYGAQLADEKHRWLSLGDAQNTYDALSCKCGYHVCTQKGACAPRNVDRYARARAILGERNGSLEAEASESYDQLFVEMRKVAPKSWFFEVPRHSAIEVIRLAMVKYGPGFRDPLVKDEIRRQLRLFVPTRLHCSACGAAGTMLAGRVCADGRSCDERMTRNMASSSFSAPRMSG